MTAAPPTNRSHSDDIPELDDDDRLIGRLLTRREVLALMGLGSVSVVAVACAPGAITSPNGTVAASATAAATASASPTSAATATPAASAAAASALPSCVVVPELTEGPYYVDEQLERSDIRIDTADGSPVTGTPLRLEWVVSQADGDACIPLEGVLVDVWHCDVTGAYSDVSDRGFNTVGHDFLRGYQITDANGRAAFETIYPGWYSGRAVHIHFKIRTGPSEPSGFEFTSQLFFDDDLSRTVYAQGVYADKGPQDVPNADDNIYQQTDGLTLLDPVAEGEGYVATFEIAVQTG